MLVYLLSALSDATAGASGAIFGLFGATSSSRGDSISTCAGSSGSLCSTWR